MSIKENESTTLRGKGEKSFYHNCNFGFFQAALSLGKSPENLLLLQHWPCCLLLQWASSRLCFSCTLYHPPAPVFLVLPPLCLSPCAGALDVAAPTPIPLSWPLNAEQPWQRQDWRQVVEGRFVLWSWASLPFGRGSCFSSYSLVRRQDQEESRCLLHLKSYALYC